MNILFVTPVFIEKGKATTGMPNYIYRVALFLEKSGHHCCIVTGGGMNRRSIISDITVYEVNTRHRHYKACFLERIYRKLWQEKKIQKKVNEVVKKERISIIQYAGHFGTGCFYDNSVCGVPAVMRMSSYAKFYFSMDHTHSRKEITYISFLERCACRRMCSVYAPSNVLAHALGKDLGRKVGVIEPPFYNENIIENTALYEKELLNRKYFLFVGTMIENKGILVICEILGRLLKENPDCFFVFCGKCGCYEGKPIIEKIKNDNKAVEKQILYLGEVPHEKLYPIIKEAALVILPSLMENLSNACMEAMHFGKIVVATDGTSYEQLIEDGRSGFLAIPGDAKSLYNKIREAQEKTPEEKELICQNAKRRMDLLAPEIAVNKLVRYYEYNIRKGIKKNRKCEMWRFCHEKT